MKKNLVKNINILLNLEEPFLLEQALYDFCKNLDKEDVSDTLIYIYNDPRGSFEIILFILEQVISYKPKNLSIFLEKILKEITNEEDRNEIRMYIKKANF